MHHPPKVLATAFALTFFLHPLAVSAQAQEEENEQKKPVTLFEATVPSPVTTDGGVAIIKFRCDRSLEGEKLVLVIRIPVGQRGVSLTENYLYQSDKPSSGRFSMPSTADGEVRFLLSTPKISGPPDRYGARSTFMLRGERSIGVELFKCLDDKCRKKGSLSNHLTLDVVFT